MCCGTDHKNISLLPKDTSLQGMKQSMRNLVKLYGRCIPYRAAEQPPSMCKGVMIAVCLHIDDIRVLLSRSEVRTTFILLRRAHEQCCAVTSLRNWHERLFTGVLRHTLCQAARKWRGMCIGEFICEYGGRVYPNQRFSAQTTHTMQGPSLDTFSSPTTLVSE